MKANKVLKLLNITRQTLCNYIKQNKINVIKKYNNQYDYNDEDVYKLLNKNIKRKQVIYCRVSTQKQKKDLENQKETLQKFCLNNNIIIDDIYEDISSGISLNRNGFQKLLLDIVNNNVSAVYITYEDRLSRLSFNIFKELFKQFNCKIIVLNKINHNNESIEKEIFSEIISIIHCLSMKLYSNRRKEKLKLIEKDLSLEDKKY